MFATIYYIYKLIGFAEIVVKKNRGPANSADFYFYFWSLIIHEKHPFQLSIYCGSLIVLSAGLPGNSGTRVT